MKRYQIKQDQQVELNKWDTRDTSAFDGNKREGKEVLLQLNQELESLQELLFAQHRHKVLIVLQGMDTSGKDGTIRHVFEGVNPQGVKVAGFKVPTEEELSHDYLWRVHKQVPAKGEIVIFNRSHYEDVLVVRVHELVRKKIWQKRYDQIKYFESMLADEGTTILKFFLHISPKDQKERLQARLDEKDKRWKFNPADLKERKLWPEYTRAYEDAIHLTSTEKAPWFIVPADRKWYRNLVIASILVDQLKSLKMQYPQPSEDLDMITIE